MDSFGRHLFTPISIGISDVNAFNNRKLVFRITFQGNNTGTTGNTRFDNITLDGLLGAPSAVSSINSNDASVYKLFPNPASDVLNISSNTYGEKSVAIYDVVGKTVFEGTFGGQNFSVNTSEMNTGVYFINIKESSTGVVTTKKFIKQ